MSKTLADYRSEVSATIGLDNTASSEEQGLIDGWVNEGVLDILTRTSCKVLPSDVSLTAGENDYELDANILSIVGAFVTTDGTDYWFERTTPAQIIDFRRNATSTSSPARWYAVAGANLLMVYPTPDSADTLTLYYVPAPAELATGTDEPSEIPAEWHRLVTLYALWRAADYDEDTSSAQGERYRQTYEQEMAKMRRAVSKKGGHRLAPTIIPPRQKRWVSPDPSRMIWRG